MFEDIGSIFTELFSIKITIPASTIYGQTFQGLSAPLWVILATGVIVYTILWLLSAMIPAFKEDENKKVRTLGVLAATIMVVFLSPILQLFVMMASTLLILISMIMFVYLLFTVIPPGIPHAPKLTNDEERDIEKYFPNDEKNILVIEKVTGAIEKNAAKEGDPDIQELANEENSLEITGEDLTGIVAEGKDIEEKLKITENIENVGEKREQQELGAIYDTTQELDKSIPQGMNLEQLDENLIQYAIKYLTSISELCILISSDQKKIQKSRIEFIESVVADTQKIDDIIKRFKKTNKALDRINKILSKRLGQDLINKVRNKISAKRQKLKELSKTSNEEKETSDPKQRAIIKEQRQKQYVALQQEISEMDKQLENLQETKKLIQMYIQDIRKVIKNIQNIAKSIVESENKIDNYTSKSAEFIKKLDNAVKNLEQGAAKFSGQIKDLAITDKENRTAEEIPTAATEGITQVFSEVLEIQKTTFDFYANDVKPLIIDVSELLKKALTIEPELKKLHDTFKTVNQGYISLKQAATQILGTDRHAEYTQFIEVMRKAEILALSEENTRVQIINQTITQFEGLITSIDRELGQIQTESESIRTREQKVLNSLNRVLERIIKEKSKFNKNFEQKAEQFKQKVVEAAQKINN